jgi:hypothetical protein
MPKDQTGHDLPHLAQEHDVPAGECRDPITLGALTASRVESVPLDARRRWAHSATIIEIETGRDYYISGGTDWFEIAEGVVFTVADCKGRLGRRYHTPRSRHVARTRRVIRLNFDEGGLWV